MNRGLLFLAASALVAFGPMHAQDTLSAARASSGAARPDLTESRPAVDEVITLDNQRCADIQCLRTPRNTVFGEPRSSLTRIQNS